MTVRYGSTIGHSRFGTFITVLFHWKGSIYKALWREILVFLLAYAGLSSIYRFALTGSNKAVFETFAVWCQRYAKTIPLTFILGFYVSTMFARWWQQFLTFGLSLSRWILYLVSIYFIGNFQKVIDELVFLSGSIQGTDEDSVILRRTMIRYINLCSVMGLRLHSSAVAKRFPTLDELITAGFLTEVDKEYLDNVQYPMAKFWVPCTWTATLLQQARDNGQIESDYLLSCLIRVCRDEVGDYCWKVRLLTYYDWVVVPLMYTQVVAIAIYSWAFACLLGRQHLDEERFLGVTGPDYYVPIFTLFELAFYLGWMKVAESMFNPFGEDDEDFESNRYIDMYFKKSFQYVDHHVGVVPPLVDIDAVKAKPSWGSKGRACVKPTRAVTANRADNITVRNSQPKTAPITEETVFSQDSEVDAEAAEIIPEKDAHKHSWDQLEEAEQVLLSFLDQTLPIFEQKTEQPPLTNKDSVRKTES